MRIGGEAVFLALLALDISRSSSPISKLGRKARGSKSFTEVIQNLGAGSG
jgi:hypothetical protein